MYEYEIYNKVTGEYDICYGYNTKDMMRRQPNRDWENWVVTLCEYID